MRSDDVFNLIERIAATPKKTEKVRLLKEHWDDVTLRQVLVRAYNPNITYGISASVAMFIEPAVLDADNDYVDQMDMDTEDLLLNLEYRTYTGTKALEEVAEHLAHLTPDSGHLLRRIIAKDLRAGINDSTINEAIPGLIPEYPYQRCTLLKKVKPEKFDWKKCVFSQLKADAMFVNVTYEDNGRVWFSSRQGKEFRMEGFRSLVEAVKVSLTPGYQYHGEIMVFRDGKLLPRKDSNGLINHVNEGGLLLTNEEARIMLWDEVPLQFVIPGGRYDVGYEYRFDRLETQLEHAGNLLTLIPTRVVHSLREAIEHAVEIQSEGGEGTVFKDPWAPWQDGTSPWQVKVKLEVDVDLRITGLAPGTGKFASTFGSLIVETSDSLLVTKASGLKDKERQDIFDNWPRDQGAIATVRANDLSEIPGQTAALMHGRFVEIRKDKSQADTLDQVRDQFESAKQGK